MGSQNHPMGQTLTAVHLPACYSGPLSTASMAIRVHGTTDEARTHPQGHLYVLRGFHLKGHLIWAETSLTFSGKTATLPGPTSGQHMGTSLAA